MYLSDGVTVVNSLYDNYTTKGFQFADGGDDDRDSAREGLRIHEGNQNKTYQRNNSVASFGERAHMHGKLTEGHDHPPLCQGGDGHGSKI